VVVGRLLDAHDHVDAGVRRQRFQRRPGRTFSIFVLLTGTVFLLILLPFTLIRFFYLPFVQAQAAARVPRRLPENTRDHMILTHFDPVSSAIARKLNQYGHSYTLLAPSPEETERLSDLDFSVILGYADDSESLHNARIDRAALVTLTSSDVVNTKVAFSARHLAPDVSIIATADKEASVDILELGGCSQVLQLREMLSRALARLARGGKSIAYVIGQFDELHIAEAPATGTPMVGKTLEEIGLRREMGITVIGVWERGRFSTALPQSTVEENTILVLAGPRDQLYQFEDAFRAYNNVEEPVVILGGGRVGWDTARSLEAMGLDYRIVEKLPERVHNPEKCILGDAAELSVLEEAGIMRTSTAIVTTQDDDMNIYLTIYCRSLRPDVQIISRTTVERYIALLHEAGANFVLSFSLMGANAVLHYFLRAETLMIAEGLDVFRVKVPKLLSHKTIAETHIRRDTGCTEIALCVNGYDAGKPGLSIAYADGGGNAAHR
jgi:voltage-gated potassium channel